MLAHTKRMLRPAAYRLVSVLLRQEAQLAPERLLAQYRQGRFPMAARLGRLTWHDPETRAILPLDDGFHVPREVRKLIRKGQFAVSFNQAFREVIAACAEPAAGRAWSWISPEIGAAYYRLHQLGHAHSVEVWNAGRLVGGGYGISIGGFFSGESMFYRESHASKVAMVHLVERLREGGFTLHDGQMASNLSRQFGVVELPRDDYHALLGRALAVEARF